MSSGFRAFAFAAGRRHDQPNRMMTKGKKFMAVAVAAFLAVVFVFVFRQRPEAGPGLAVVLTDGTRLSLEGMDCGRRFFFGGGRWQRMVCRALGRELPFQVRGAPLIFSSVYTNGVGLDFRRMGPAGGRLSSPWNGEGELLFVDDSGVERAARRLGVNFDTQDLRSGVTAVVGEEIFWEIPMLGQTNLRLVISETNSATGLVLRHNVSLRNPGR